VTWNVLRLHLVYNREAASAQDWRLSLQWSTETTPSLNVSDSVFH